MRVSRIAFVLFGAVVVGFGVASLASVAMAQPMLLSESFDTLEPPRLPAGWSTSSTRLPAGDFVSQESTPHSAPVSVLAVGANVEQWIETADIFTDEIVPAGVSFYERRSGSHDGGLIVEASVDGGRSYIALAETLRAAVAGIYLRREFPLAGVLGAGAPERFRLRWRLTGDGTGSTATFRLDDVRIAGKARFDIAIDSLFATPSRPRLGSPWALMVVVANRGIEPAGPVQLRTTIADSMLPAGPLPGERLEVAIPVDSMRSGTALILAVCAVEGDLVAANDTIRTTVRAGLSRGDVIINEIMYGGGMTEYVELLNRSGYPLDASGWTITDRSDTTAPADTIPAGTIIAAGGYPVLAADSGIHGDFPELLTDEEVVVLAGILPGLNDAGDLVWLRDDTGLTLDSLVYSPEWHTLPSASAAGRALERVHPASGADRDAPGVDPSTRWATCAHPAGGTPGRSNSVFLPAVTNGNGVTIAPNPFSPDGDGIEDLTALQYRTGARSILLRIRIFDVRGRMLRALVDGEYRPGSGTVYWNGAGDDGRRLEIGMYPMLFESVDAESGEEYSAKGLIVVAGRME